MIPNPNPIITSLDDETFLVTTAAGRRIMTGVQLGQYLANQREASAEDAGFDIVLKGLSVEEAIAVLAGLGHDVPQSQATAKP